MVTEQRQQTFTRRGVRALMAAMALVAALAGVFATGHTARAAGYDPITDDCVDD
jgi:hypothetical protein